MKLQKSILLTALVVVISGCIGIPDVFGRDVISIQQSVVENGVRDVIVVKDILTIPKSPLLPDQQVALSFILESRDTLKSSRAYVDLFNAPTMRSSINPFPPCNFYAVSGYTPDTVGIGRPLPPEPAPFSSGTASSGTAAQSNQRYCVPDQCGIEVGGCPVLPGEEKPVNFDMKTPSSNDIKNIKTQTKLDFKVTYDFEGSLSYILPAVNKDEIIKRQRAGEKTSLFTTKSYGSGPVQIDVELQGAPYMISDFESVLLFKIKNRGSGTLAKSQIDSGKMTIIFPPEIYVDADTSSEKFTCTDMADGTTECVNDGGNLGTKEGIIPLYRDESRSSLRFGVRLKQPLEEPFRSYQITSTVLYSYELRNYVDLTINPFQNV